MKTTLRKQLGLWSMLVICNLSYAQPQNELLLPYVLHDSIAINSMVNNNISIIPLQASIRNYVDDYLDDNAQALDIIRKRNSAKIKTIQNVLEKSGLPSGLMYLAIVESELDNSATSHAGAAGIWQLMPETARTFGLQVNGKTDQRRHTYRSTVAAADYIKELYQQFDDWLLVVAAYNCGAGKVYKAIKQSGSREFWKLQRFLPAESRNHVKHFIATHFYYEKAGSIVTLTKKERLNHFASLNDMATKKETAPKPSNVPVSFPNPSPSVAMFSQDEELFVH